MNTVVGDIPFPKVQMFCKSADASCLERGGRLPAETLTYLLDPLKKTDAVPWIKFSAVHLKKPTNQPTWGTLLHREPNDTSEMTAFGELRCCCLCYKHSTQQIHIYLQHMLALPGEQQLLCFFWLHRTFKVCGTRNSTQFCSLHSHSRFYFRTTSSHKKRKGI